MLITALEKLIDNYDKKQSFISREPKAITYLKEFLNSELIKSRSSKDAVSFDEFLQYLDKNAVDVSTLFSQQFLAKSQCKIIVVENELTKAEAKQFHNQLKKPFYVLIKNELTGDTASWTCSYYENGKKERDISISKIAGLQETISKLPNPNRSLDEITNAELKDVTKAIKQFHQQQPDVQVSLIYNKLIGTNRPTVDSGKSNLSNLIIQIFPEMHSVNQVY